ncbi:MAG: hypothetical protein E6K54_05825 [Gammaproteobacteria bacterium]|nr:MAG: hypothetical protein E6K54_05825 [Gammaproteobacteria bacterium]
MPSKKDPNLPEYIHQLQIFNRFSHFIRHSKELTIPLKEDAYKVIDCLKFIKINLEFIGYAVEHRNDDTLYTYTQDKSKGVIRDFNNTAMHFNSYSSTELVQTGLKNLVEQFEQAIETMQEKGELEVFAKKLQFDGDVGCIEARTAAALSFAVIRLSHAPQNLNDLMVNIPQSEDKPTVILDKASRFFESYLGQPCL